MIYLDSSVALAHLFDEARRPPAEFWQEPIQSSRLLEFELWNRLNAYGLFEVAGVEARRLLDAVSLLEMTPRILSRALQPFPGGVRTLDGLHLATMHHLRSRGAMITLASYDARLLAAAGAMGFAAVEP